MRKKLKQNSKVHLKCIKKQILIIEKHERFSENTIDVYWNSFNPKLNSL